MPSLVVVKIVVGCGTSDPGGFTQFPTLERKQKLTTAFVKHDLKIF